jgi:hypothetical protein
MVFFYRNFYTNFLIVVLVKLERCLSELKSHRLHRQFGLLIWSFHLTIILKKSWLRLHSLSSMTNALNVKRTILVHSLHIGKWHECDSGQSWENVILMENCMVLDVGSYVLLLCLLLFGFSPHTFLLFLVPSFQLAM